jgi:hypothetical protein
MRAAVIPTTGRADLEDCMEAIAPQVDFIVLVAHRFPVHAKPDEGLHVVDYFALPPNISEMWNLGLQKAEELGANRVAVLNDDAIVYPSWFEKIEQAMAARQAAAGWSSGEHAGHLYYTQAEPTLIRMTGYAFVVQSSFRADEQFQWWYGDNDLEWRARQNGGVVHVGGSIEHRHPNATTVGWLAAIAGQDAERFRVKWGTLP